MTLFPIHSIVFSSQCVNLPKLSSPKADESANTTELHLTTIPVVPLSIPSPQTFPQLAAYLYTRNSIGLLAFLLPLRVAGSRSLWNIAHAMAEALTVHSLLTCAMTVNGIWQNVCALGVFDLCLWDVMDAAWEVIIASLSIKINNLKVLGNRVSIPDV